MRNNFKILVLFAIIVVVASLLVGHFINVNKNNAVSKYNYNLKDFKTVDDKLISHKEFKQISLAQKDYIDIDYHNEKIYLLSKRDLQIIFPYGAEFLSIDFSDNSSAFTVSKSGDIYVCFGNYIIGYKEDGYKFIESTKDFPDSYFSSIALGEEYIFVADAGKKQVVIFDKNLVKVLSFNGESGVSDIHGFIVPSNYFTLDVDNDDELWVVNPGLHAIQNYSHDGKFRRQWSKTSFEPDGFTGCCNPCFFSILDNGNMITSEKGLVRVKIHKESGELVSVVAAPDKFKSGGTAPAITYDKEDNIIILDFDKNMIRFFKKSANFEN